MTIEERFNNVEEAYSALNAAREKFWANGGFDGADISEMEAAANAMDNAWGAYIAALRSPERGRSLTAYEKAHNYYGMSAL